MSEILNDITQNKFINWIESSKNDGSPDGFSAFLLTLCSHCWNSFYEAS